MKKRILGDTGMELSVIGFGGIVVMDVSTADAEKHVAQAIDRGINYFDIAPSYGNAEERLGPALRPYRDQVFLACKTTQRTAKDATTELKNSLKVLQTDHFDLYQLHGVSSLEESKKILAPGGALEALIAARDCGLINHIGFSAHSEEAAIHLLDAFPFDSVMFPINQFCWHNNSFGSRVCKKAVKKGTGILALKTLAHRKLQKNEQKKWAKCWYIPVDTLPEIKTALSFTLSKPVTAAVSPGHAELLWLACDAVESMESSPAELPQYSACNGEPVF